MGKTSKNKRRAAGSKRVTASSKRTIKSTKRVAATASSKRVTTNNRSKNSTTRRTSLVSLENGINILRHAIKNKVSLSAASIANKRGKNYISDIKARLEENYKSKNISKNLYDIFRSLHKQYEKTVK